MRGISLMPGNSSTGGYNMARMKLNPTFCGFSGKIRKGVSFNKKRRIFVRHRCYDHSQSCESVREIHFMFRHTAAVWKIMDIWMKGLWEKAASRKGVRGYNLFLRRNLIRLNDGLAVESLPGDDGDNDFDFIAGPGETGMINCFLPPELIASGFMTVCTREKNGSSVAHHNPDWQVNGDFAIGGLKPGAAYLVYIIMRTGSRENEFMYSVREAMAGD
jgi:hypothetical protein